MQGLSEDEEWDDDAPTECCVIVGEERCGDDIAPKRDGIEGVTL